MLSKFLEKYKIQKLVGLDLSADSIKIIEVNTTCSPFRLEHFSITNLPPGTVVKGEVKDFSQVKNALKDTFRTAEIQNKNIAFSIPRSSTVIKNVKIDSRLTAKEIETRAWIEANHHFPDLVGEIYLDFSVDQSAENPSELDLTLVACRKDQLKPYLEAFQESGLIPQIIDVNSFALERALALVTKNEPDLKTVALLNIDSVLTTFLVSHHQKLVYAHDHSYDGARMIALTNEYFKNNPDKQPTLNDADYADLLKNILTAHLRHTMHFFYSSLSHISIQKIILSGDCASIPCLAEFVQQESGIETIIANPILYLEVEHKVDKVQLQKSASTLMLATGLSLSQIT